MICCIVLHWNWQPYPALTPNAIQYYWHCATRDALLHYTSIRLGDLHWIVPCWSSLQSVLIGLLHHTRQSSPMYHVRQGRVEHRSIKKWCRYNWKYSNAQRHAAQSRLDCFMLSHALPDSHTLVRILLYYCSSLSQKVPCISGSLLVVYVATQYHCTEQARLLYAPTYTSTFPLAVCHLGCSATLYLHRGAAWNRRAYTELCPAGVVCEAFVISLLHHTRSYSSCMSTFAHTTH